MLEAREPLISTGSVRDQSDILGPIAADLGTGVHASLRITCNNVF